MAEERGKTICPGCGKEPEEAIWLYCGKLFCSEDCVRKHAGMRR